jgi:hypothetical protein
MDNKRLQLASYFGINQGTSIYAHQGTWIKYTYYAKVVVKVGQCHHVGPIIGLIEWIVCNI